MEMREEYFRIAAGICRLLLLAASGGLAAQAYGRIRDGTLERGKASAGKRVARALAGGRGGVSRYEAMSRFLKANGAAYMFRGKVNPVTYLAINIALSAAGLFIGFRFHALLSLPGALAGFKFMDFVIWQSNKRDNENMLEDVKNLYDILRIQTKAGEHITTALADCYAAVKNPRLKKALQELTSTISGKHDIEEALGDFQGKFANEYIDALVISISQSLKTGQAAQMFEDMSNQIEGIDRAILLKEKQQVQNKVLLFQVLIYMGILATVVYTAMSGSGGAFQFN